MRKIIMGVLLFIICGLFLSGGYNKKIFLKCWMKHVQKEGALGMVDKFGRIPGCYDIGRKFYWREE
ncbi:hypothetical protein [Lachnoclostridium sp. An138]|uniref:hypothetical protein n=1 Tax=Lachnoclostridium sp. An138 TaxID=1965560 RepID=UPI001122541D|nr:hypothetical protein [Lachnoclostridium sp. An138]